jgi:hypothetical protein
LSRPVTGIANSNKGVTIVSSLEKDLEELVLKESIVSAAGINADNLLIGIRGDPSMRETTVERRRYSSSVDEHIDDLLPQFEDLLLNRSTYQLFVGFNNGEIRTSSVFDPLTQEIHTAEKIMDEAYLSRQFPEISFEDKIQLTRDIYDGLRASPIYQRMPGYWHNILKRRRENWEPMEKHEIMAIISTLKTLREMPTYYMRNITINILQSLVRIQFNCDGTQILDAENYTRFLEENLPS